MIKKYHVGKNLFNKNTITSNTYVALDGTKSNANYYCSDYIPVFVGDYYLQNVVGSSIQNTAVVYDSTKQPIRYANISGQLVASGKITIQSGEAYIRINTRITTDSNIVTVSKGDSAIPYEVFESTNLFDVNGTYNFKSSAITRTNGTIVDTYQSSGAADRIYYDKVYPAGTYTISLEVDNTSPRFFSPVQFSGGTYNQYYDGYYKDFESDNTLTVTFTNDFTIGLIFKGSEQGVMSKIMLNTGSTALPYTPYGDSFKDWFYRKYGTETETFTSLPKTIIGDGQPISAYTIKGNIQQSGTPTPSNPVYPTEVGEKTANLYDKDTAYFNNAARIDYNNNLWVTASGSSTLKFQCQPNTQYTLSVLQPLTVFRIALSNDIDIIPTAQGVPIDVIIYDSGLGTDSYTFTTLSDTQCIIFQGNSATSEVWKNGLMLSAGSTALPYEPFGYKIPILSNGTTYPIYLSEPIRKIGDSVDTAPSTGTASRIIKQVVLTGQESWNKVSGTHGFYTDFVDLSVAVGANYILCSHYVGSMSGEDGTLRMANNKHEVLIYDDYASAADFQTFLQQQYAAGTPVTVWYVLATAQTESFTAPTLPTSGTAQSFDVDTTLKPSEVSLTYHGWHEHSDEKYMGGGSQ